MKPIVALVCLSGSAVHAEPAPEPERASDTGAYAAARLGMQATNTTFGDTGKSPVVELELGRRHEPWLAYSVATSFTGFDDVAIAADRHMLDVSTRLIDGRARVTFILDDPSTTRRAGYIAGVGFGVLHTRREGLDVESRLGPLGELFLGLDRAIGKHVAVTLHASVALGTGFLGRVSAGIEIY